MRQREREQRGLSVCLYLQYLTIHPFLIPHAAQGQMKAVGCSAQDQMFRWGFWPQRCSAGCCHILHMLCSTPSGRISLVCNRSLLLDLCAKVNDACAAICGGAVIPNVGFFQRRELNLWSIISQRIPLSAQTVYHCLDLVLSVSSAKDFIGFLEAKVFPH